MGLILTDEGEACLVPSTHMCDSCNNQATCKYVCPCGCIYRYACNDCCSHTQNSIEYKSITEDTPDPNLFGPKDLPHNQAFILADELSELLGIRMLPAIGWNLALEQSRKLTAIIASIVGQGEVNVTNRRS